MKKQILSTIMSAALLLTVTCTAAVSANAAQSYALSDTQKQQADAAIEAFLSDQSEGTSYTVQSASNPAVTNYSVEDGFEVQYVDLFGDDADFTSYSTRIRIPYANGVVNLSESGGKMEFASRSIEENGTSDIFVTKKDEIQNTIERTFEEEDIQSIQYVEDPMLYLSAVTIQTSDELYVIPYFTSAFQEDYEGITQGSVYTSEDWIQWVGQSFKENEGGVNEEGELLFGAPGHTYIGGGSIMSYIPEDGNGPLLYVGISAGVLLLAGGAFFLIRKRGNLPAAQ